MGNQRAVCERRQLQFPATISISVEKLHLQIRLRILVMQQNERKSSRDPKSQREKVPVGNIAMTLQGLP